MDDTIVSVSGRGPARLLGDDRLARLLEEISRRRVPVGALNRLWSLGSAQAGIFRRYVSYWLRKGLTPRDRREELLSAAHLDAALRLFGTMGYMRGAVMKLGQAMAALPEIVPGEFAEVLGSLHFEAPPMHYAMIREVFEAEMGAEPEDIFTSFERRAFAAASLGQVHRARLRDGREVAVKIQYPHMAGTIRADVRNLRLLLSPLRYSADWGCLMDVLADVERILTIEADYRREAGFCREAAGYFDRREGIVVPEIFPEYSTGRILTMEYLPGCHLREFLAAGPGQELRNRYADLLTIFWGRLYYGARRLVADPHPGNFIFMPDGKLGLIDFGCTRVLSPEEIEFLRRLEAAFFARDRRGVEQAIAEASVCEDPSRMDQGQLDVLRRAVDWQFGPLLAEGVFDWSDEEFFRRGLALNIEIVRKRCARTIPLCIWTNRMVYGFRAICFRLQARNSFGRLCRAEREKGRGDDRHP